MTTTTMRRQMVMAVCILGMFSVWPVILILHRRTRVVILPPPTGEVLICIASSQNSSHADMMMAANNTWIKQLPPRWHVIFFVGGCHVLSVTRRQYNPHVDVLCLPIKDGIYPPLKQVLMMHDVMSSTYGGAYQWYIKMDSDAYVNVLQLQHVLSTLQEKQLDKSTGDENNAIYAGRSGYGRPGDLKTLGLKPLQTYCLGMAYIMNTVAVQRTKGTWDTCLRVAVSFHDDVEVARCLRNVNGAINCFDIRSDILNVYYTYDDSGRIAKMAQVASGQMGITFPKRPSTDILVAAIIHPIKDVSAYYRLHKQIQRALRPLHVPISEVEFTRGKKGGALKEAQSLYNEHQKKMRLSCVNNPKQQMHVYGNVIPECTLWPPAQVDSAITAYPNVHTPTLQKDICAYIIPGMHLQDSFYPLLKAKQTHNPQCLQVNELYTRIHVHIYSYAPFV